MFRLQSAIKSSKNVIGRRFASEAKAFNNPHNFNINPPPVHEYWNQRNATVLVAFVPLYLAVGYLAKYLGEDLGAYDGLLEFANGDDSPLKKDDK